MSELRYLMEKYLQGRFEGAAHSVRVTTLDDFVTWVENEKDSELLARYLNSKLVGTSLENSVTVTVTR